MSGDLFDDILDDLCDIMDDGSEKVTAEKAKAQDPNESVRLHAIKTRQRHVTRRAFSEQAMNDALDWHLEDGCTYHCISGGDVDSLTYLRGIVKQEPLDYCLISTWCMAMTDAEEVASWVRRGLVKRLDMYVGEIFTGSYSDVFDALDDVVRSCGGRMCVTRNHSKVMVGIGRDFDFAIASSANVNTNPRIEQTTITVDRDVARFYKDFFDGLKPFNEGFESWTPWRG